MNKGLFIAVYGVNNIGKSTHCRILCEKLKREGYQVISLKYPVYDLIPTGHRLNEILRGGGEQQVSEQELQALFTQNRQDFEPQLQAYLDAGNIVVAEDYTGTGIAWGMAKGLPQDFMEGLNAELLSEDFALLLTGQRDARATEKQHIHEQNQDLLASVNTIFSQLAAERGWKTLEIQPDVADTANLVWKTVQAFLEQHPEVPKSPERIE